MKCYTPFLAVESTWQLVLKNVLISVHLQAACIIRLKALHNAVFEPFPHV